MIAIFLDTNFFYEFCDIEQILWTADLDAERVKLLLTHAVIREMDAHKDLRRHHMTDRASATLVRLAKRFASSEL